MHTGTRRILLMMLAATLVVGVGRVAAQKAAYEKDYDIKRERGPSMYDKWAAAELKDRVVRLPVVEDVLKQELKPAPEYGAGVKAAYLRLLDNQMVDVVIYELPPGASTKEHRHTYEEFIYIASGTGRTTFNQGGHKQALEWKADGFFAVPLNAPHAHENAGTTPVRFVSITSMPFMINIGGNSAFLYANTYDFRDRYRGQEDYFRGSVKKENRFAATNYVAGVKTAATDPYPERGGTNMHWDMGGNSLLGTHISEFEVGSYKRAHRHRHEAIIYILNGTGYSLVWKEPGDKPQKVDWREGGLFLAPVYWFHQHFNTGTEPVRYLAITAGGALGQMGVDDRDEQQTGEEDPAIRQLFDSELKKAKTGSN